MGHPMRRGDRAITQRAEIEAILKRCQVCHLAIADEPYPYVLPLNFGYVWREDGPVFYFHSAKEGRKLDLLRKNSRVAACFDTSHAIKEGETACRYGYYYESVMVEGEAVLVEDAAEKAEGLTLLMRHQTGREDCFTPEQTERVAVIRLRAHTVSAKANRPAR
ncbi:MAG: pyridoxamine 5'-phosphate oxidase family protein [Clostridia bacterium]|nr:pyridoxamine 5'-phosphate oxidase family protein [Clostridia bacterium]